MGLWYGRMSQLWTTSDDAMTIEVAMQLVDALSDVALSSAGEAARRGRYIQSSGLKWLGRTLRS